MSAKSSSGRKCQWFGGRTRDLDNEEALTILNAVVDFRSKNGGNAPTPTTMKPVFDAVKGSLKRPEITIDQLYNKFRNLKNQYNKAVNAGVGPTPFDRKFFELSVKAWGEKRSRHFDEDDEAAAAAEIDESSKQKKSSKKMKVGQVSSDSDDDEEEDEEGKDDSFKYLTDQARKYWEMEGMPISSLELGLKFMDKKKAADLEMRWRQHLEWEMKILVKSLDAKKDLNVALVVAGQKGACS